MADKDYKAMPIEELKWEFLNKWCSKGIHANKDLDVVLEVATREAMKRITYLEAWMREAKLALNDVMEHGDGIRHDDLECSEDADCACTTIMRVNQLFEDPTP